MCSEGGAAPERWRLSWPRPGDKTRTDRRKQTGDTGAEKTQDTEDTGEKGGKYKGRTALVLTELL